MSRSRSWTRSQLKRVKRKVRGILHLINGDWYKEHPEQLPESVGKMAATRRPCSCPGCANRKDIVLPSVRHGVSDVPFALGDCTDLDSAIKAWYDYPDEPDGSPVLSDPED